MGNMKKKFFALALGSGFAMTMNFDSAYATSAAARGVAIRTVWKFLSQQQRVESKLFEKVNDSLFMTAAKSSQTCSTPVVAYWKAQRLAWADVSKNDALDYEDVFNRSYNIAYGVLSRCEFSQHHDKLDVEFSDWQLESDGIDLDLSSIEDKLLD